MNSNILRFCRVAEGEVDIHVCFEGCYEWDTAAGHAILKGVGGNIIGLDDKELIYRKKSFKNQEFIAHAGGGKVMKIVFDLDGVIFESLDSEGNYLWCKTIHYDLGISEEQLVKIFSSDWPYILKGKIDIETHLSKILNSFNNVSISPKQFVTYWLTNDTKMNAAMLDFVRSLKSPSYIATNQEVYKTAYIKKHLRKYFKRIFSSSEMGYIKPEEAFFKYIEKALQIKPERLVLVDDQPENIFTAKICGWKTFLFQNNLLELKKFLKTCEENVWK